MIEMNCLHDPSAHRRKVAERVTAKKYPGEGFSPGHRRFHRLLWASPIPSALLPDSRKIAPWSSGFKEIIKKKLKDYEKTGCYLYT
jgi:hypothetical protein